MPYDYSDASPQRDLIPPNTIATCCLHIQCGGAGEDGMPYLDVTNPALFTATNADTCERLHFLVPFNAERAQMWSDRAANIIEATRAGELLPRGFDDPEDWRCRMCAHHSRCWG